MIEFVRAVRGAPKKRLSAVLDDAISLHRGEDPAGVSIAIMMLDDAAIAEMNASFLGHDGPTDVIAFEHGFDDPESGRFYLGDVAVNAEMARREAAARGIPWQEELILYAAHGTLHLLGFRDKTVRERAKVRTAERELLARHGIVPHWDD